MVTGGASGIGLGVARQLVADGHAVAVLDRNGAAVTSAVDELRSGGGQVLGIEVDVTEWDSVAAAVARVHEELGPVTILVTSAGIEAFDPLLDITPARWNDIIAVNLTGTFTCVQAVVPDMLAAGWGRIITISSQSAQSGCSQHGPLFGLQGRHHRPDQVPCGRPRPSGRHRQFDRAEPGRHADGQGGRGGRGLPGC